MNWRSFPDLSPQGWQRELTKLGSPMAPFAADIARAASPHGCLALAFLVKESRADTLRNWALQASDHNPLNISTGWAAGSHTWASYPSYADCIFDWNRKLTDPNGPYAKTVTLEDLVHVYAPAYDNNNEEEYVNQTRHRIAAYAAADGEEPTVVLTFGNVPHPPFQNRPIEKAEGNGWNNLGQRTVKGVVLHRMIGTLWGTDGYFRQPSVGALTDYGVGNVLTDGEANDGLILRWNDPLGVRSGWASGPVNGAYGDGLAFVNKYGVAAVNRDQASIEISGRQYADPISDNVRNSVAALIAYWADQARIPHDTFPVVPADGISFVRWHQEFTIGTGKVCPGKVVMDATKDIILRAKAQMQHYQTQSDPGPPPAPVFPKPIPPPAWTGKDVTVGGVVFRACRRELTATENGVLAVRYASRNATPVRTPIAKGETMEGFYKGVVNGEEWWITASGARVPAASLDPKVTLT